MNEAGERYAPVGPFERATGICPLYAAVAVADELEHYLRAALPADVADQLARRAERVLPHNARWGRRVKGRGGREFLRMFMRHWLSGLLWRRRPDLFRRLPASYLVGHPLPFQAPRRRPAFWSADFGGLRSTGSRPAHVVGSRAAAGRRFGTSPFDPAHGPERVEGRSEEKGRRWPLRGL